MPPILSRLHSKSSDRSPVRQCRTRQQQLMGRIVQCLGWLCLISFGGPNALAARVDLIWSDLITDQILRTPADGSGPVTVLVDRTDYPGTPPENIAPWGLDVSGGFLYWGDALSDQILRRPLAGGQTTQLYSTSSVRGLAVSGGFVYWADALTDQILRTV